MSLKHFQKLDCFNVYFLYLFLGFVWRFEEVEGVIVCLENENMETWRSKK